MLLKNVDLKKNIRHIQLLSAALDDLVSDTVPLNGSSFQYACAHCV